jgi:hypothetical protein
MAIHVYSPASAASVRGRAGRSLDHMKLIPTNNGAIVEHHFTDGDGMPSGPPDRYTHTSMSGLHDHLMEHFAPHMPEEGARAEAATTAAGAGTPRGRRA